MLEKVDLSKLRGKEAVAELRKQKQEKLDEQKKLLDRKLQARYIEIFIWKLSKKKKPKLLILKL